MQLLIIRRSFKKWRWLIYKNYLSYCYFSSSLFLWLENGMVAFLIEPSLFFFRITTAEERRLWQRKQDLISVKSAFSPSSSLFLKLA